MSEIPIRLSRRPAGPPPWQERAACKGETELFFRTFRGTHAKAEAEAHRQFLEDAFCSGCPVREPCLQAGQGEQGIWAGTDEQGRRRALRRAQAEERKRRAS